MAIDTKSTTNFAELMENNHCKLTKLGQLEIYVYSGTEDAYDAGKDGIAVLNNTEYQAMSNVGYLKNHPCKEGDKDDNNIKTYLVDMSQLADLSDEEQNAFVTLLKKQQKSLLKNSELKFESNTLTIVSKDDDTQKFEFGCNDELHQKISTAIKSLKTPAKDIKAVATLQPMSEGPVDKESTSDENKVNLFEDNSLQTFQKYFEGDSQKNWKVNPAELKDPSKTNEEIRQAIEANNNQIDVKLDDTHDGPAFSIHHNKMTIPDTVSEDNKVTSYQAAAGALSAVGYQLVQITAPDNDEIALTQAVEGAIKAGMVPVVKPYQETTANGDLHKTIINKLDGKLRAQYDALKQQLGKGTAPTTKAKQKLSPTQPIKQEEHLTKEAKPSTESSAQESSNNENFISKILNDTSFEISGKQSQTLLGALLYHAVEQSGLVKDENKESIQKAFYETDKPFTELSKLAKSDVPKNRRKNLHDYIKNSSNFTSIFKTFFEQNDQLKQQLQSTSQEQDLILLRDKTYDNEQSLFKHKDKHGNVVGKNLLGKALEYYRDELYTHSPRPGSR